MANKRRPTQPAPPAADRTIQYIGIAVAVLVIGFFAWQYIPRSKPASTSTGNTVVGTSEACQIFDEIPAAAQYSAAPPQLVDESSNYFATFKMANGGEFVAELYTSKAPITVNSFVFLSCKGFFNGLTFHRVLEDFMAQGGDPQGTGGGGPGYEFVNESSDLTFDKAGVMAMANAGPNTNGSQFFITFGPAEFLNGGYTIFGQVIEGMDVVNAITRRDPDTNPSFTGDVIESITITK
jgi:cyclophilin family peptidyl-prolyl cis-trans isomerase